MKRLFCLIAAALAATVMSSSPRPSHAQSNPFLSSQPGYPKWAPFTGVQWKDDKPIVQVNGAWYELVSIHGVPVEKILQHSNEQGWNTQERVEEDLVQIIRLMGHKIDRTTNLVLRDESGKFVTMDNVPMTEEKRRQIVVTSTRRAVAPKATRPARLTREAVLHDLAAFQASLESQFSYLKANGVDTKAAIQAIRDKASDGMDVAHLAEELQKVIALFIDGHAGVSSPFDETAPGRLPFLIEPSGERLVAVRADRSQFLDPDLPYIRAIDGVAIERWLEAASVYIPKGSPQYVRDRGLRLISYAQHFRGKLGIKAKGPLEVELVSRDGKTRRTVAIPMSDEGASYGTWPPVQEPAILDGNIGYLRLAGMDDRAEQTIREWMPRFRDTDGLIVDVRDNGGGSRGALIELAACLLSKDDPPRIASLAKYRLAKEFPEDHLTARFMYREDSDQFTPRERQAIRAFAQTFQPQWTPPADEFSEWHYLVLSKRPDDERYDYRKPAAILMDEGCLSATDIFLGAFKGWPNVTLIGQPSAGGSARVASFQLPRSGISVRCASMASFQPSGKLYDTNGVEPDITVTRPPEYYLIGGPDVVLEAALARLRAKCD